MRRGLWEGRASSRPPICFIVPCGVATGGTGVSPVPDMVAGGCVGNLGDDPILKTQIRNVRKVSCVVRHHDKPEVFCDRTYQEIEVV